MKNFYVYSKVMKNGKQIFLTETSIRAESKEDAMNKVRKEMPGYEPTHAIG